MSEQWCPCGCGRKLSPEAIREMEDNPYTHTTTLREELSNE